MNRHSLLMVLAVTVLGCLPGAALAQDSSCRGLVGGAMALCVQGMGPSTPSAASPTAKTPAPAPARAAVQAAGTTQPRSEAKAESGGGFWSGMWNSVTSSLSSVSSSVGSGLASALTFTPTRTTRDCQGLAGAAVAHCLQGVGTAGSSGEIISRPEDSAAGAGSESATESNWSLSLGNTTRDCDGLVGAAMAQCLQGIGSGGRTGNIIARPGMPESGNAGTGKEWSFSLGNNSLPCQGLVGGAMAQCLQGMGPAGQPGSASLR